MSEQNGLRKALENIIHACDSHSGADKLTIKNIAERALLADGSDSCSQLRGYLKEAIDAIQVFHGPGWEIYRDHSPEMRRWKDALKAAHAEVATIDSTTRSVAGSGLPPKEPQKKEV
jgi:hypothetical protein